MIKAKQLVFIYVPFTSKFFLKYFQAKELSVLDSALKNINEILKIFYKNTNY